MKASPTKTAKELFLFEELEPRVLFSADFAPGLIDIAPLEDEKLEDPTLSENFAYGQNQNQDAVVAAEPEADSANDELRYELLFVDANTPDAEQLVNGLLQSPDDGRQIEVVYLDSERDGIAQITEALAGQQNLDAVHFISHGNDSGVQLGNTWLEADNLQPYSEAISSWSSALDSEADLLFYGCDLAGGEDGRALLGALGGLTGADVAASDDLTGNALLGGDWDLEYKSGDIESAVVLSMEAQQSWSGTLAIALDAVSDMTSSNESTITLSHTTAAGSDRLLVVGIDIKENKNITSVTYNGVNLTNAGIADNSGNAKAEIWYLKMPDVGTYDVVVNLDGNSDIVIGAATYTGVDQTTPLGTFVSNTGSTITASAVVSSAADEWVFDTMAVRDASSITVGAGQTQQWNNGFGNFRGGSSTEPGAGSVTMSWTLDAAKNWAIAAVPINPATATATTTIGDGVSLADRDVWEGGLHFAVNAFTLATNSGTDTLTDLDVAFTGTDPGDVAPNGVKLWRDDGSTANEWDATDTLIGTASLSGATASFTGLSEIITTSPVQYLVTYDIAGTATPGNALQASVTAVTVGNSVMNNDTAGATLTVMDDMVHETSVYKAVFSPGMLEELYLKETSSPTNSILSGMSLGSLYSGTPGSLLMSWDPDVAVTTVVDNSAVKQVQMSGRLISSAGDAYGTVSTTISLYEDRVLFDMEMTLSTDPGGADWMFMSYAQWNDAQLDENFEWTSNDSGVYNSEDPAPNFNSGNVTAPISYQGLFELGATDGLVSTTLQNISNYNPAQLKNTDPDTGGVDIAFQRIPTIGTTYRAAAMYSFDTTGAGFDTSLTEQRQDDYVSPAVLDFGIAGGDGAPVGGGFSVERGAYTLDDGDADDHVKFDFQVGAVTPRKTPVFEIGNWNDTGPVLLRVDGVVQVPGIDYQAGVEGNTLYLQYLKDVTANAVFEVGVEINDAPVLSGANDLTAISEDPVSNPGTLVSDLISGQVSDADPGALEGIAVIGVDDTNGSWEYTTDGGSNWFAFGAVDTANARLLAADASTNVRFVPNANWNGTVSNGLTFHAWDQTSGTAGATADLTSTDTVLDQFTTAAYGNNDGTASWAGPWVETDDGGGGASGGQITVDSGRLRVQADHPFNNIYREADLSGATSATLTLDFDNQLMSGDVVRLEISSNGGSSWNFLKDYVDGGPASGNDSFDITSFIASNTQIRFTQIGASGDAPIFFDNVQIEYTTGSGTGGTTAYSVATASSSVTVNAVDDAPTATNLSAAESYTEDAPPLDLTDIVVSDVDSANVTATLTLSDVAAGSLSTGTSGSVTSTFAGGVWTASGAIADVNTLLSGVTFTPAANYDSNFTIATSVDDGVNPAVTGVKNMTVTAINDAPVLDTIGSPTLTQIDENDINNPGDAVVTIVASAGGDPITDVDALAVEGIAVTWADNSNGSWEYSTDNGSNWNVITATNDTNALLLTDDVNNRIRFVPATNFNGTAQFSYRAWDTTDGNPNATAGVDVSTNGGATAYSTATETATVSIRPVQIVLHFSTTGDVTSSGAPGLDSWDNAELLGYGDPNLSLGPGTTDGTFYQTLDLRTFVTNGATAEIDAIHHVSSDITVGGNGGPSMDLFTGDVLFSVTNNNVELTGSDANSIMTDKKSVYLFQPDTPNDYSAGTFSVVLERVSGNTIEGVSLVETDTLVGDTLLQAGTFLYNVGNNQDILHFTADGVGLGGTAGTISTLVSGADIGLGSQTVKISGLDLVEGAFSAGAVSVQAGNILVTLDGNDNSVGNNGISVTSNDVFYLDLSTTTMGPTSTTSADAHMFLQGAGVGLDTVAEEITALSLDIEIGSVNQDPVISLPGGALNYTENDPPTVIDAGATATDANSLDFASGILRVDFNGTGTSNDRLAIRDEGAGPGQVGVMGMNVTYGGVTVGTFTGGTSGASPLVITFNSNADAAVAQAVMRNITYENVSDDPSTAPRSVRFVLTDGDTGTSNVETEIINVAAVNDAPTATNLSAPEAYVEDVGLNLTDIAVTDVDSANVTVTLTLSDLAAGSLSTGTSGAVTSTFAGGVWTASGAVADVNNLLAGVIYTPSLNYNSAFTIDTSVSDGVAPPVTGSKAMTATGINDAPTATNLNAPETYTEDTPLDLTDIVVSDIDSTDVTVTLTLSDAAAGSLSTGTSGAVTSTFAGGVWTASGAIADVNTLLAGVTFNPALNYDSDFTIATSVDDGSAAPITGVKNMTATPVDDAPTATNLDAPEVYATNTALDLTDIVVSDVDSANVTVTLTLSDVAAGSLSTGTSGSVTSTFVGGVWTASGAIADVNTLLAGVTFNPALNYDSNFTIATSVDDGVNPAVTGSKNVVANSPTATNMDAAETYTEDTPLDLVDIVISDPDSANVTATLTLSDIAAGSLSTGTSGSVTSTFVGGVWTASGAIADVNTLLAGVTFNPAADYNSDFTITTSVDDGTTTINGLKNVTGTPVNDAPTGADNTVTLLEDDTHVFSAAEFGFGDVDTGDTMSAVRIDSLSLPAGSTLQLWGFDVGVGLVIQTADIPSLVFTPAPEASSTGYASFTFSVRDQSNAFDTAPNTMTIDVTNVDDAPTATNLNAPETYTEDTALDLTDIVVSDVDSANVTVTLTLSDVAAGTLSTATSGSVTSTFVGGVWTANGAIADVNALLSGVTFNPASNYDSNFTIATSVDDGVNPAVTGTKNMRYRRLRRRQRQRHGHTHLVRRCGRHFEHRHLRLRHLHFRRGRVDRFRCDCRCEHALSRRHLQSGLELRRRLHHCHKRGRWRQSGRHRHQGDDRHTGGRCPHGDQLVGRRDLHRGHGARSDRYRHTHLVRRCGRHFEHRHLRLGDLDLRRRGVDRFRRHCRCERPALRRHLQPGVELRQQLHHCDQRG